MPQARLEIPVALRPELKRDYECSTIPVDLLAARAGMSGRTFSARIRELGWMPRRVDLRGRRLPPAGTNDNTSAVATMQADAARVLPSDPADCAALAYRIRRAIEQELAEVERVRRQIDPAETGKAEGIARTLAALARTLQEAMRLEDQAGAHRAGAKPQSSDHDDLPRDFEELRRKLSRRLDALVAEQEREISRGN